MTNQYTTANQLDFKVAPWHLSPDHLRFQIGTCDGLWGSTKDSYYILSVSNSEKGNGHLEDVFQWFEHSCRRDARNLLILETMNKRFYEHLIAKRGFISLNQESGNLIKVFNKKLYKRLLKFGNELIKPPHFECV